MKTILLSLLLFTSVAFSQDNTMATTSELEYNYLTSGYEDDLKQGRNIKDGYSLKGIYGIKTPDWQFVYEGFIDSEKNTINAVLITITKLKNNKTKYLCLPLNNKILLAKFMKDYEGLGISMGLSFDVSVFDFMQRLINNSQDEFVKD